VQHLGAHTNHLDFSPLGFYAPKLAVKVIFLAGNSNSQKGNEIISPISSHRI
jgi:hypothetical protein